MKSEAMRDYLARRNDLAEWTYELSHETARESFYTRRRLDMKRSKEITRATLTVHVDAPPADGAPGRGSAQVSVPPGADRAEVDALVDRAVDRARVSRGPAWRLPAATVATVAAALQPAADAGLPLDQVVANLRDTIFGAAAPDSPGAARFSALEIFAVRRNRRFMASNGTSVDWQDLLVETELVATAGSGEDEVELVDSWSSTGDAYPLESADRAWELLRRIDLRLRAQPLMALEGLPVLLRGEAAAEFFSPFFFRCAAAQVRSGAADTRIGAPVLPGPLGGDPLTLGFDPFLPGSPDGRPVDADSFPLRRTVLVDAGVVRALEGPARHASALGVSPVGACGSLWVAAGSLAGSEIEVLPHLEALVFSDFYVDASSGEFGGELRLGVLHRDKRQIPVRGGSLSGSLAAEQADLRFSSRTVRQGTFLGPDGVLLRQARITPASR